MPLIHNPSLIQECPDHELGDITESQYYGDDILDMPIPTEEDDMRYLHLEDQQEVEGSDDNNPCNWDDVLISKQGVKVKFIIDSLKDVAWKEYQDEVNFLKEKLKTFSWVFMKPCHVVIIIVIHNISIQLIISMTMMMK